MSTETAQSQSPQPESGQSPAVRIGTRGSALAVTQTTTVAEGLAALGGFPVELVRIRTEGDVKTGPLSQLGGTGVFVAALRQALLEDRCDVAVHSLKDLPTGAAEGLTIAAIPARVDVRDALCARDGLSLSELPAGARVGTGSPRRAAQLRAARPDLQVVDIRGNVDTRLGRVAGFAGGASIHGKEQGDLDAVVLAAAGLSRLGRLERVTEFLDPAIMLPAPGQGALAVECRSADAGTAAGIPAGTGASATKSAALGAALRAYDDADARLTVTAERALLARLEAGCSAPIGALARLSGGRLTLEAVVCSPDGSRLIRRSATAVRPNTEYGEVVATLLGTTLAEELLDAGAGDLTELADR